MDAQDLLNSVVNVDGGECTLTEAIDSMNDDDKKELIRHIESTLSIDFEDGNGDDFEDLNEEDSFEDET